MHLFPGYLFIVINLQGEGAQQSAKLIYETALLESGFVLENPKEFALHVHSILGANLNLGKDIQVEEEHEAQEDDNNAFVQSEEDQMDSHTVENNPVFHTYVTYIDFTFTLSFSIKVIYCL